MKNLIEKLKSLSAGILALSFLMAVSLSSCTTQSNDADDADATEATEQAEGTDEHPAGEEHPTEGGDEHPSDSTATEAEHPE